MVKLDIEGGEWELLEHVIASGGAHLIDYLSVEWHLGQRAPHPTAERQQLKNRRKRIDRDLRSVGVRMLPWESYAIQTALKSNVTARTKRPSGRCDVEGPAARIRQCCERHPRAMGCWMCTWRGRGNKRTCTLGGR